MMGTLGMNFLSKLKSLNFGSSGPDLFLPLLPSCVKGFDDIFNKPLKDSCLLNKPDKIINLKEGAHPIRPTFYCKFALWEEDFLKGENFSRLLENGVIHPSGSSWRHFPVIV